MTNTSNHEFTAYGVRILKNAHPDMRRIKRNTGTPSIHGNKFWKSTFLLMDYLSEFPLKKGARVLEVGCGYGLGGIFCAKQFGAEVTSLDADAAVFPYLQHHADINDVSICSWKRRYEQVTKKHLLSFDLLIGADICFWDNMSQALFNLMRRAKQAGTARVVITDPGRPPFREMAERAVAVLGADYLDWHSNHPHNASGLVLDFQQVPQEG